MKLKSENLLENPNNNNWHESLSGTSENLETEITKWTQTTRLTKTAELESGIPVTPMSEGGGIIIKH